MALEALITELTAALKENTAALNASKGTATAAASTTKKVEKPEMDEAKLRALATKVMEGKGKPFAKKLIKDVGGAADLANVKPDKMVALAKAFEAALAAPAEEPAEESDDEL